MRSCRGARLTLSSSTRLFLIDGHNLLFALRARFAEHLVDGHPGTAAREALVHTIAGVFTGSVQGVRIYFDGCTPHREQRSTQVEVVYPGGEADQCADRAILRDLTERDGQRSAGTIAVVTRDIKLARQARKRGASVMHPAEFFDAHIEQRE